MTPPAATPLNANGSGGWTPPDSSQQRLALDNLLRRELKVPDPSDAQQVAQALLNRYQGTPRARSIQQEARGLPNLPVDLPTTQAMVSAPTSTSVELQQALDDVERDLRELTTNTLLKDVTSELEGWAHAVRTACREGIAAARFGLDSRQRDKALGIRRQLGDYARMARLVGALTPTMNQAYRSFGQSLDEVSAVIVVTIGDALASAGFNGGRFLLQVPYAELQVRRDAVVYALRNLIGATQEAYDTQHWPRGLDAYRQLFDRLEQLGYGDLRALLLETELVRTMDVLIERAQQGSAEGLRATGATAQIDLQKFYRLIMVGQSAVRPKSPPLTGFLEALLLFATAFDGAGGARLLRIARPPILFYGLYGNRSQVPADERLARLVAARGALADALDCYLGCGCLPAAVQWQVAFDMVLYHIDRAIDLYALGKADFEEPERRAAAYIWVIDRFGYNPSSKDSPFNQDSGFAASIIGPNPSLVDAAPIMAYILEARAHLDPLCRKESPLFAAITEYFNEANEIFGGHEGWGGKDKPADTYARLKIQFENGTLRFEQTFDLYMAIDNFIATHPSGLINPPRSVLFDAIRSTMHDELCVQSQIERKWQELLLSMVPSCANAAAVLELNKRFLEQACRTLGDACAEIKITLPPQHEVARLVDIENVDPSTLDRIG